MTTMNRSHRKKAEVDEKTKAKIVSLFVEHGVTMSGLQERFSMSNDKVGKILDEAGVARPRRDRAPPAKGSTTAGAMVNPGYPKKRGAR